MELTEVQAQREAAIQPKISFRNLESPEFTLTQVREQIASLSDDEVNREILAQLYAQNKAIGKIKGHLAFYTVMYILALVAMIVIFKGG